MQKGSTYNVAQWVEKNRRGTRALLLALGVAVSSTGCSGTRAAIDLPEDGFALIGGAEGIRAFSDYQNGVISNSRISADKKSAHWEQRNIEAVERTKRTRIESFWGKMFGQSE